jgi:hypothetical protein
MITGIAIEKTPIAGDWPRYNEPHGKLSAVKRRNGIDPAKSESRDRNDGEANAPP